MHDDYNDHDDNYDKSDNNMKYYDSSNDDDDASDFSENDCNKYRQTKHQKRNVKSTKVNKKRQIAMGEMPKKQKKLDKTNIISYIKKK